MQHRLKVAIGGFLTECNHFGGIAIEMKDFLACQYCTGERLLQERTSVCGGMLHELHSAGAQPAALMFASACPGGPITSACFDQLLDELLSRLHRVASGIDGVLLPLHGASLVDGLDDPEGELIGHVRKMVGPNMPIVVSVDLHAHITRPMVRFADAIVAWDTYPHHDQYTTGQRAARILLDTAAGKIRPTMAMGKVPVITSAIHGATEGDDPFAHLMRFTKSLEHQSDVVSSSLFLIHPYMDCEEMGSGGLVVTDGDQGLADRLARQIAERYWDARHALEPKTVSPQQAIAQGMQIDGGPILLVETADCCGGGAAGDSIATLSALVDFQSSVMSLVPVVDPEAAELGHRAGAGARLTLELGHRLDPRWGSPLVFEGVVERLGDGEFVYSGGMWDGQVAQMGPSVVFRIDGIRVLITSNATYDWADEQFRCMGLEPGEAKFIVAKNPMNYRSAYKKISAGAFVLNTPGPTPATLKGVRFRKLQRPYFPADSDIPNLTPTILH